MAKKKHKYIVLRDPNVVEMIGKKRVYKNKKRAEKADKTGRKAKHKEAED